MKAKKKIEGICGLCGKFEKLSFEHVPPQAAFNNKPIYVQTHEHLTDQNSRLHGKRMKNNKGFGDYTLCVKCNNNTGDWYARDFSDFAQQGMKIITGLESPQYIIHGTYNIKPLNVIKQILTMFLSADRSGHLRSQKELVDFILTKEMIGLPKKYKVFLYSTLSHQKRMMGYQIVFAGNQGIQKWSEINFQPFGYLLAEESEPAHKDMCDISNFGNLKYGEKVSVEITTAYLNVEGIWIGTYN